MILIILGLLICILSHPKILRPIMQRLFNEGIATPQNIAPDKTEIIKYTGPSTTLLFIGIVFIFIGIISIIRTHS